MAVPELLGHRGAPRRLLRAVYEGAEVSQSRGAVAGRRAFAGLCIAAAVALAALSASGATPPSIALLILAVYGAAFLGTFSARFVRDWTLVFGAIFGYVVAERYVQQLHFPVYYAPQLDADRIIGLGTVPTVWLQQHLYTGRTGALELFAVAMYASHFFAPVLLGFYLWLKRLSRGFVELALAILAASILSNVAFVLFPTAPPWLAAEKGQLAGVHHMLRDSLVDLNFTGLASAIGDPQRYNIVAAFPSLHAAFPVIALIVALRYGLPRWLVVLQAAQLLGVFFAIVYLGDHYVVDAVAGAGVAVAGAAIVRRALARPGKVRLAPTPALSPMRPVPVVEMSHPSSRLTTTHR